MRIDGAQQNDSTESVGPSLPQAFALMQDFMLHKGIITDSLGEEDLQEFVNGASNWADREGDIEIEIRIK